MQTSEGTFEGLTWEGASVELADVERELSRLWHETVERSGGADTPVRCSVLNLVVHTSSDADAEQLYETVGRLSSRHPLRAIILSSEPHHTEASLNTTMNVRCADDPASGSRVCCEQVLVEANGEPARRIPGVVRPLLLPDLPVYLWWMGEPPYDAAVFKDLMRPARKLILDTGSFIPQPSTLRRALEISRGENGVCAVTDLSWIRLWRWIETVAQLFDDPALLPHLRGIRRVRVEYAASGEVASPAQAALLAGWLYSRLGQKPAPTELVPVPDAAAPGGTVLSFEMETSHDAETARFSVRVDEEGASASAVARVLVGDETLRERAASVAPRADAELLDIALKGCQRDVQYEEAVAIAAQLLEGEITQ